MIYTDTHLHSSFSSDSDTPMELMIKQGIRLGMKTLCFTEHYDPCYPDTPDGLDFLLDFENYKKTLAYMGKVSGKNEDKIWFWKYEKKVVRKIESRVRTFRTTNR